MSVNESESAEIELAKEVESLLAETTSDNRPRALRLIGRIWLVKREYSKAIDKFNEALASKNINDHLRSDIESDLGLAQLQLWQGTNSSIILLTQIQQEPANGERAAGRGTRDEYKLQSRERALKLNSNNLPALFNLALWEHKAKLWYSAVEAWKRYLEKDSSSQWANEARENLEEAQRGLERDQKKQSEGGGAS